MFPDNICQNIDILIVINVKKNNFGFHSNQKTQGHKHLLNNFNFKRQVCQMKLKYLNTFLQFRQLFHEPHCSWCLYLQAIRDKRVQKGPLNHSKALLLLATFAGPLISMWASLIVVIVGSNFQSTTICCIAGVGLIEHADNN